jgi:hypothetical protein
VNTGPGVLRETAIHQTPRAVADIEDGTAVSKLLIMFMAVVLAVAGTACDSNVAGESQRAGASDSDQATDPSTSETPEFAAINLKGRGNAVKKFKIPRDAVAIAEITHRGARNFAIWSVDRLGTKLDLLVNTIGDYNGTVLFDEQPGQHSAAFQVEADGTWRIRILPIERAPKWNGRDSLDGRGDSVIALTRPTSGLLTTNIRHEGSRNFAVWAYGDSTDLLVNEIGRYKGESLVPAGTLLFEVQADGRWRFSALK